MFDFVCLGDATRDLFLFAKETPVFDGGKHPVEKIAWSLGGNAANVSVGLSRLKINSALVTVFGNDERGIWIKKELMKNNVDLSFATLDEQRQSNLSTIVVFGGERTIFSYHSEGSKQIESIPECQWVYLTSAPDRDPERIFDLVIKNHNFKLAFNPAPADLKKDLKPVLAITDVLIMNKEEAEVLGTKGPKITVITDGKNGVAVYAGDKVIQKPSLGNGVVEPTGAGDAFSSGFLAALFHNHALETALDWGLKNSGSVIQQIGAIDGLLTYEGISN